jgi:hypothetical protein
MSFSARGLAQLRPAAQLIARVAILESRERAKYKPVVVKGNKAIPYGANRKYSVMVNLETRIVTHLKTIS